MEGLRQKSTVRKNVNVLQHILGYLKSVLDPEDKQAVLSLIEDYHNSLVPLVVPLALLKHYVNKHRIEYI